MSPVAAQVRCHSFCLMYLHLCVLWSKTNLWKNLGVASRCLCFIKFTLERENAKSKLVVSKPHCNLVHLRVLQVQDFLELVLPVDKTECWWAGVGEDIDRYGSQSSVS